MAVHLLDPMTGLTLECELLETTLMDGKTYGSMTPIDAPVTIATLDKAKWPREKREKRRTHRTRGTLAYEHPFLPCVTLVSSPCVIPSIYIVPMHDR